LQADAEIAERVRRKVTLRLVPLAALLYLLAYLDRVNIGFAALTMNADLGLTATAYGFAAGIFSLGYVLFEVPSNIALERVGPRRWIARIMITWGLLSAAMAMAQGPVSLAVLRFLLGAAEAGLLPGIVFYLSQWVPLQQRARIMSAFFVALPVTFILGAPLSTALLSVEGFGLRGWQWMFIIEGLASSLTGLIVLRIMTERPQEARWLTPAEKAWLIDTLAQEYAARGGAAVATLRHGLANARVWLLGVMYAGVIAATGSLSSWLPLFIKGAGSFSNFEVGLITAMPYLAAMAAIVPWSRHADATGELKWHVCLPMLAAAVSFAFGALAGAPLLQMAALGCAIVCIYVVPPVFWTMSTRSLNGPAAAAGIALINCLASVGGFVGPQAIGLLKDATGGIGAGLLTIAAALIGAAMLGLWLNRASVVPRPS
jgi:ACS family tartrate transporter-like MFS transporter